MLMRRIIVLSDDEIKNLTEGKEVEFEFCKKTMVLVSEKGFKDMKKKNNHRFREVKND